MAGNHIKKTSSTRPLVTQPRARISTIGFDQALKALDFNGDGKIGTRYTVRIYNDGRKEILRPNPNAVASANVKTHEERGDDEIDTYLKKIVPLGVLLSNDMTKVQTSVMTDLGISLSASELKENCYTKDLSMLIKKKINPAEYDFIVRTDW